MEPDLWIAILAMTLLSSAAFSLGHHLAIRNSARGAIIFAQSLLVALTFAWCYAGKLGWAAFIPASAALYWSNAMPILLGFSAGLAMHVPGLTRWHRPLTACMLGGLGVGYILAPVLRPVLLPPQLQVTGVWRDDVCLQTHPASCGAAAAATLLRLSGVPTSEQVMADACLTSAQGTMPLGLYRGLALEAGRQSRVARVASEDPADWLELRQIPNLAMICFPKNDGSSLTRLLGTRGEGHAVVVLGRTDAGRWIIGDPAIGRICWTDEEFRSRFTGEAIYVGRDQD